MSLYDRVFVEAVGDKAKRGEITYDGPGEGDVHRRVYHKSAAHDPWSGKPLHDIESFHVRPPEGLRGAELERWRQSRPRGVPHGARFHHGFKEYGVWTKVHDRRRG